MLSNPATVLEYDICDRFTFTWISATLLNQIKGTVYAFMYATAVRICGSLKCHQVQYANVYTCSFNFGRK